MNRSARFSNDRSIPMLGLGTYESPKEQVKEAVKAALKIGYRHIDCAFFYRNEIQIGEALKESMRDLKLKREDIFVTSKCWCTYLRPELVRKCCEQSLRELQLDYLDLYLVHWPVALKPGSELFPTTDGGRAVISDKVPLLDTWKAMEDLVAAGLVRSIGISNFNRRQIDMILKGCRIQPVNLQVEIHANFPNTKLVEYAHSVGLTVTAYAPLGSPSVMPGAMNLLTVPWVGEIAKRHGKTPAQVLLRYLLQRNLIVIPKSVTESRIEQNSQIFDFVLSDEEMKTLNTKGSHQRQFVVAPMKSSPEYPFNDEY